MNKKGFTLIELLAVIIILGVLMIIAIPSVTKQINDSRNEAYIDTARQLINGARSIAYQGNLDMFDKDTTYYVDVACIDTTNKKESPYGIFTKAYVVITYDDQGFNYFWTSVDETGKGIKNITAVDKLEPSLISENITTNDILNNAGINGRNKYVLINENTNCGKGNTQQIESRIDGDYGKEIVCKRSTTLHQDICNNTTCTSGETIIYGQLGTKGTLNTGDAFDCDVNYDGKFNSENERFYYIISNNNNAVLIYYKNTTDFNKIAYDSSGENWHGPRTAVTSLPLKSVWKNPGIVNPGQRQIINDEDETSNNGHNYASFNYSNYAARFITYQELDSSCKKNLALYRPNSLTSCLFLLENTMYSDPSKYPITGYWAETPSYTNAGAYGVHSLGVLLDDQDYYGRVDGTSYYGVRPVIEVSIDLMGY